MSKPELYDEDQCLSIMLSARIAGGFIDESLKHMFHSERAFNGISPKRLSTWCQLVDSGIYPWTNGCRFEFVADSKVSDELVVLLIKYRDTPVYPALRGHKFSAEQVAALTLITKKQKTSGVDTSILWLFDTDMSSKLMLRAYKVFSDFEDSALPVILRDIDVEDLETTVSTIVGLYEGMPAKLRRKKFSELFNSANVCLDNYVINILNIISKGYELDLINKYKDDPQLALEISNWLAGGMYGIETALDACVAYMDSAQESGSIVTYSMSDIIKAYRLFNEKCFAKSMPLTDDIYMYTQPRLIARIADAYTSRKISLREISRYLTNADMDIVEVGNTVPGNASPFMTVAGPAFKRFLFDIDPKLKLAIDEFQLTKLMNFIKHISVLQNYEYDRTGVNMIPVRLFPVYNFKTEVVFDELLQATISFPREEFGGKSIVGVVSLASKTDKLPVIKIYM